MGPVPAPGVPPPGQQLQVTRGAAHQGHHLATVTSRHKGPGHKLKIGNMLHTVTVGFVNNETLNVNKHFDDFENICYPHKIFLKVKENF